MTQQSQNGTQGNNTPATQTQKLSTNKVFDEEILMQVKTYLDKKQSEGLTFPENYNVSNALTAAKLHLMELKDNDGKLIVDQCTLPSVVNSLIKYTTFGFNINKKHCAFIKYGNELVCQPEYFGNLLIAKRDADVKEVNGQVVYQGDKFVYEVDTKTGRKRIVSHEMKLENQDITKIKGGYAVVVYNDGSTRVETMTMDQVKAAWNMGKMSGKSKAHNNFTDQMVLKTVCNRAVKLDINTSDDSELPDDPAQETREKTVKEKGSKQPVEDVPFEDLGSIRHPYAPTEGNEQPSGTDGGSPEPNYD